MKTFAISGRCIANAATGRLARTTGADAGCKAAPHRYLGGIGFVWRVALYGRCGRNDIAAEMRRYGWAAGAVHLRRRS